MRSTNKPIQFYLLLVTLVGLLILLLKIGFSHEKRKESTHSGTVSTEETGVSFLNLTEPDLMADPVDMTEIDLADRIINISKGGNYYLSGQMNGSIHINAPDQIVHLFLDKVAITSKQGPALLCENADKLIITLMNNENTLSDSANYANHEDTQACIYSVCDMTFNGNGSLLVNAHYEDAIRSRDILKIVGGEYAIKCKRTAFHGNDGIVVSSGSIMISSEKNAFKTTKGGENGRGSIIICGGNLNIIAGMYAFVSEKSDLYIYNCSIHEKSIIDTYNVAGSINVQEGCFW